MKITDVRALNDSELRAKAQDLRHEKLNLRIQQQSGQLERPSRLREIRRNIARIESVMTERKKPAASKSATEPTS
ncbi:MAG: 50S ribosomal protein L29 [Bdellovibrionaceae bacterium]|nr:50S ribosomal protein L29 [Pseudobdellovibrionaceae bacterium]